MISKQALSSKIAVFALLVLFVFLGNIKYRQYKSQRLIEKEKQNLLQQAENLEKKNKELSSSLDYLNSAAFKEKVAREQLDLKKQDEVVFNFTSREDSAPSTPASKTNFRKWLDYFFAN